MIDARDHIGVPVITDVKTVIHHKGHTYLADADAGVLRESDLHIQFTEDVLGIKLTDWQRNISVPPLVTRPKDRYTFTSG
jgi:hypothetical protein